MKRILMILLAVVAGTIAASQMGCTVAKSRRDASGNPELTYRRFWTDAAVEELEATTANGSFRMKGFRSDADTDMAAEVVRSATDAAVRAAIPAAPAPIELRRLPPVE